MRVRSYWYVIIYIHIYTVHLHTAGAADSGLHVILDKTRTTLTTRPFGNLTRAPAYSLLSPPAADFDPLRGVLPKRIFYVQASHRKILTNSIISTILKVYTSASNDIASSARVVYQTLAYSDLFSQLFVTRRIHRSCFCIFICNVETLS